MQQEKKRLLAAAYNTNPQTNRIRLSYHYVFNLAYKALQIWISETTNKESSKIEFAIS
jgi:hypothetical protein